MDINDMAPLATETAALLKTLSHPARLMICCQLRNAEMSVGDMETRLGIRQPNLSRELAKLRDENLVTTRKESKVVFYKLSESGHVAAMIDAICSVVLGHKATARPETSTTPFRPNRPGGYGVFARTGTRLLGDDHEST